MKLLPLVLAAISCGSLLAASTVVVPVSGEFTPQSIGQIAAVDAASDKANGTIVISSIEETPIYTNAVQIVNTYRRDYTFVYTNGTGAAFTNTTAYNPMPLGPGVISFVTNDTVIASVTNRYKALKRVITVTNQLYSGACVGSSVRTNVSDGAWIVPGQRILSSGTCDGSILVILK